MELRAALTTLCSAMPKQSRKGYLLARMKLGKLYATGMNGCAMDCKDVEKAKKCFWSGNRLHCSESALSLVQLFETEIEEDPMKAVTAEDLYRCAMSVGKDDNNEFIVNEAVDSLRNLLLTEHKLQFPGSETAKKSKSSLKELFDKETDFQSYIKTVEEDLLELSGDENLSGSHLTLFLGPLHS